MTDYIFIKHICSIDIVIDKKSNFTATTKKVFDLKKLKFINEPCIIHEQSGCEVTQQEMDSEKTYFDEAEGCIMYYPHLVIHLVNRTKHEVYYKTKKLLVKELKEIVESNQVIDLDDTDKFIQKK
jgi:hypothetical protein